MQSIIVNSLTVVSKELLCKLICDTYNLVQENNKFPKVQTVLSDLDIEADLKVIDALIKQVDFAEKEEGVFDVVDVALDNVKEIIELIKKELEIILQVIEDHKTKYLADYRDPAFNANLNNLVRHKIILDKRVDFMIKLIVLKKNTHPQFHNISSANIGYISELADLAAEAEALANEPSPPPIRSFFRKSVL